MKQWTFSDADEARRAANATFSSVGSSFTDGVRISDLPTPSADGAENARQRVQEALDAVKLEWGESPEESQL